MFTVKTKSQSVSRNATRKFEGCLKLSYNYAPVQVFESDYIILSNLQWLYM